MDSEESLKNQAREIPEAEKLSAEIEREAAQAFAPGSSGGQVENLVRLVNKRAHLTVKGHSKVVEEFYRRRQKPTLNPHGYKIRKLTNKFRRARGLAVSGN